MTLTAAFTHKTRPAAAFTFKKTSPPTAAFTCKEN